MKQKRQIRLPFKLPFKLPKLLSSLDTYIIGKYLGTYFFSIILIISIAVVFDFNEHIDQFVEKKAPMSAILFDYYLYFIPYYTNLFSQLFVFISVIFFTVKLADNTEIIAMMSAGVSTWRLLRPYLISAGVICVITLCLGHYLVPLGNVKRVKFENTYKRRRVITSAQNVQLQVADGVIAYMRSYDGSSKRGFNFSLDKFENKKLVSRLETMYVDYDSLAEEPGHWKIPGLYTIKNFEGSKCISTTGSGIDTMLNVQPSDFLITRDQQTTLTSPELKEYIDRQKKRGFANIQNFEFEYYQRTSAAFAAFILTIIGFSLSAQKRKNGMGISLGIGLGLSFTYIILQTLASAFATQGGVHPAIATWIPNAIFLVIAIYCFKFAPR